MNDYPCSECDHPYISHLADDEERRDCALCDCRQYRIPHATDGSPCWCDPTEITTEGGGVVVVHRRIQ